MEKFKSLQFQLASSGPLKRTVQISSGLDLAQILADQDSSAAFVVTNEDISILARFQSAVIDRKVKHKAKSLAAVLLGYDAIPIIRGSYSDAGQFCRSIRTFLKHAEEKESGRIYFVGVQKPIFSELWNRPQTDIQKVNEQPSMERQIKELEQVYLGTAAEIQEVRRLIFLAAQNSEPVLILGETGTGKEIVARSIHMLSRKGTPFQAINCGAIPTELLESTLFGYVKGAHHLAYSDSPGIWESAGNGTLLLDEIGDLAVSHQVKILRAIQEGKIRRIGANTEIDVSARVLAATNRDLIRGIRVGTFREDLYTRLDVITIETPPLRKHPADIPIIAQTRWQEITQDSRPPLSSEILEILMEQHWPGNVRELENVIKKIHYLNPFAENIEIGHIEPILKNNDLRNRLFRLVKKRKNDFFLDLWVEHGTRDFTPDSHRFHLGDRINICARPDEECQLWLVNVGTTGEVSIISPNIEGNNIIEANSEVRIPGKLGGTTGRETFFAFATTAPFQLPTQGPVITEELVGKILQNLEMKAHPETPVAFASQTYAFEIEDQ